MSTSQPTASVPADAQPHKGTAVTPHRIMQFAWGFAPPLILEAAIRHRVFDVLDDAPKTLAEIASATGASSRGLRAILDALVGLELLTRRDGDRYALTPESSAFLVSGKPAYHGGLLGHTSGQLIKHWMGLTEIVATGVPAARVNDQDQGAGFFCELVKDLFPINYPAARAFAEAIAPLHAADPGRPVNVLDLAAGSGVWGIALLQRIPQARVKAVDWAPVAEVTKEVAARFGVGDRLGTIPGDLLEADFGRGYQIATLGHILHSEGEPRSRRLLKKVFDALASGGTIAIAEFLPNDDRTGPPMPLIFGVNMLVHTREGDVFTFPQIAGWLAEAGFADARLLDVPAPSPLILATKP